MLRLQRTAFVMSIVIGLSGLGMSAGAVAACGNSIVTGKVCQVTFQEASGNTAKTWRYLQLIQIHLRELDTNNELMLLGCETDVPGVQCSDVESGQLGGASNLKAVKRLTYLIAPEFWNERDDQGEKNNKRKNFQTLFTSAYDLFLADDGTNARKIAKPAFSEEPNSGQLCTNPAEYVQPCYNRPVCVQFGKCSKSTTSCVQCTPAP